MIRLVALLDGTLVDPATPIVRADDFGVTRGDGVFDATLAVAGRAQQLDAHLGRLARSAALLDLPEPDLDGFRRAVDAILAAWDWAADPEAIIRVMHTRGPEGADGPHGWAIAAPVGEKMLRERRDGVKVLLLDRGYDGAAIQAMPWLLPGAKFVSYAINMAAGRYAAAHGADDVVFHTPAGRLLEGPTSGLVVDRDGVLTTPPPEGILPSITVATLLDRAPAAGLTTAVAPLDIPDLLGSRGAWLLSSGRLIARITHADGRALPTSPLDPDVTRLFLPTRPAPSRCGSGLTAPSRGAACRAW